MDGASKQRITMPCTDKRVYTVDEIAAILRVSRTSAYRFIKTGKASEETEYGTVNVPAYSQKGLAGVVYEVKNSAGMRLSDILQRAASQSS